jgi:hypothetical protein
MDEPTSLNFEYGDPLRPRGNALAYWRLTTRLGDEDLEKLIVTNFVISPLTIGQQSVAATFPPQLVDSRDELLTLAQKADVDLILVGEVKLPAEDFDFESFFRQQLSYFVNLVALYTERYGVSLGTLDQSPVHSETKDEVASLHDINRLADQAREAFIVQQNASRAREMLLKIRRIAHTLNSPIYKYDIEELLLLLSNPDKRIDTLSQLYFRKFLAICTEQYEDAAQLKQSIRSLSKNITANDLPDRINGSSQE